MITLSDEERFTGVDVARGSLYLVVQNVVGTLAGVLGYAFLARFLSRVEMGVVAGLNLVATLFVLVSGLGLFSTVVRFVSVRGRGSGALVYLLSALSASFPLCFVLSLVMFLFSCDFSGLLFKTSHYSVLFKLLSLDVLVVFLARFLVNFLWGLGRLRVLAVCNMVSSVVRWFFVVVLVWLDLGLDGVVLGWILGDFIRLLLLSFSSLRGQAFDFGLLRKGWGISFSLLRFSFPLYISSIISFVYNWYDRVLILMFLPLGDLGVYDVAYKAFSVLGLIATAIGSALLPYYGRVYSRGGCETISFSVRRVSRYSALIMFPLAMGLAVCAKPALTLFAGYRYALGWPVLAILSAFGLIYGVSVAFTNLLLIFGRTDKILIVNLVSVLSSLVLLPLLHYLGLCGLAVVRGVSMVSSFVLSLWFLSKVMRIEVDVRAVLHSFVASVVMGCSVLLVECIHYSVFFLPVYVLVGVVVYTILIRVMGVLDEKDALLLRRVFGDELVGFILRLLGLYAVC